MKYKQFYETIEKAVKRFTTFDCNETIKLISHLDADGISACAILIRLLTQENRKYSISIVQQLDREKLLELSKESYSYFIFSDLGSGQINTINELFPEKQVIILDHHEPEKVENLNSNIIHINPHLLGIDGSKEISGAGVVYLFATTINKKYEDLAHIAIIGAIGDIQEERGFLKLNNEILETAVKKGKIEVKKGLRMFGIQTKPLHKVLEYSTDPYIPGISGSESGAIQFLHQIGIEPKNGNGVWKKLIHLNDEEMKKLVAGIIMKRANESSPEDVLGQIYTLPHEEKESPTRDAKEFATLLNACGRMDRASFGMGTCLGIKKDKQKAFQTLLDYKKEIVTAINWYNDHKNNASIIKGKRFIIINSQDNINPNIIGTLASIISKSNDIEENTYILSLAQTLNKTTKISLRISGNKKDIDLREILKQVITKTGGEAGGHMSAAGALIQTEKEQEFIKIAKDILTKKGIEKKIS